MNQRLIWHKKEIKEIIDLITETKSSREVEIIFDRIMTTREINDIARRYMVLRMLEDGKSYADIILKTGISSSVICRLSSKCGFGFQKSSGLKKQKNRKKKIAKTLKLNYKGVKIGK